MEKKIYKFRERNDWEGESWNFYFYMTDSQYTELKQIIDSDKYSPYTLSEKSYTLDEVKTLEENSESGYMSFENYCGTLGDLPSKVNLEEDDIFYKGRIAKFCVESGDLRT